MTMNKPETFAIADRFFSAIEKGDIDSVEALYADDLVVWHSNRPLDERSSGQSKSENLRLLRHVCDFIDGIHYEILDRQLTETGFVQQHIFRGRSKTGHEVALPVAIIFVIKAGKIVRIDEYMDPAKFPTKNAGVIE